MIVKVRLKLDLCRDLVTAEHLRLCFEMSTELSLRILIMTLVCFCIRMTETKLKRNNDRTAVSELPTF